MTPIRTLVVALTALRLTRFITSDFLGEWTIVGPAKRWAWREARVECDHDGWYEEQEALRASVIKADPVPTPDPAWGWRSKLVKGLDCPYCVGFWLGALVLLGEAIAPRIPVVRHLWRFVTAALALNYAVGHISAKVDG